MLTAVDRVASLFAMETSRIRAEAPEVNTTQICEACRAASATLEVEAGTAPFRVCDDCCKRLEARALRPLEWFNLASIHGPYQFLLHDDFYDGGRACAPTIPVESPQRFPVPALGEMEGNVERLLDYAATRHFLWEETEPELVATLRRLEPEALLSRLQHRFATARDEHVEHVCLVVCGHAVGSLAEQSMSSATPPRRLHDC